MKILVIYDSVYGNTKKVAEAATQALEKSNKVELLHAKDAKEADMQGLDLLIIGSPTHGGWFSEDVRNFFSRISKNALEKVKAAAFDTSTPKQGQGFFINMITRIFGNAAPRIAKALAQKGAEVIDSKIFWVDGKEGPMLEGELKKAKKWAKELV
jgi:flavodoxin